MKTITTCKLALALLFLAMFGANATFAAEKPKESLELTKAISETYADIAEKVSPAVVGIKSVRKVTMAESGDMQLFNNPEDLMRRFFDRDLPRRNQTPKKNQKKREYRAPGQGSGVIIDAEGHILTNNHVVEDAEKLTVQMADKTEYDAEVVGTDPKTDIAIVKLKNFKGELPVAKLGDSDKLRVGNIVIAIGNPFGLMQTVTAGIVSAKHRAIGMTMYENFIQTDASINPGNSGGPLVNLDGEVVGINTLIQTRTGGSVGVGFAVPVNQARKVLEQLIKHGKVTRGWLGIGIQDIDPEMAATMTNVEGGVLVSDVYPDTPAGKAGFQRGDVLVTFDGEKLEDARMLQALVAERSPDDEVKMGIIRRGEKMTVNVKLGRQPENLAAMGGENDGDNAGEAEQEENELLGIEVKDLTDDLREQFRLPKDEEGVLVTEVDPDGSAGEAGIRAGALLIELDQKPVKSAKDFAEVAKSLKDRKSALALFRQDGANRFVVLKFEQEK
jgi:serine protease Do